MEKTYFDDMIEFIDSEIRRKEQVLKQWLGTMNKETEAQIVAEIENYKMMKLFVDKEKPQLVNEIDGEFYCPVCGAAIDDSIENYCTLCGYRIYGF